MLRHTSKGEVKREGNFVSGAVIPMNVESSASNVEKRGRAGGRHCRRIISTRQWQRAQYESQDCGKGWIHTPRNLAVLRSKVQQ